jgi:iron complex outermembrane receptor protein
MTTSTRDMSGKVLTRTAFAVALLASTGLASGAVAQSTGAEAGHGSSSLVDEVIVVGSRRAQRTVSESNVPVDVVGGEDLSTVPSSDLTDKLAQLIPSFNVPRLPGLAGSSFVRPATLRGLSPDQTLVLINGHRRHRSAFVDITPRRGAQATDLSEIPEIAIQRLEVLRDGASAQYGSDAIAGVINIQLNKSLGYSLVSQLSQYYEGDGFSRTVSGRAGLPVGEDGVLVLSGEYGKSDFTQRGLLPGRIGQPNSERLRFFYNLEAPLSHGLTFYAFGNVNQSDGDTDFSWRRSSNALYRRSIYQDAPYNIDPTYDLNKIYPGGHSALFGSDTEDQSLVTGLKGGRPGGLTWDVSARYGRNRIDYTISNTINPTLGSQSPTSFYAGAQANSEASVNADFNALLDVGLATPINVAFGAEWREETFELKAGELASYVTGPLSDYASGAAGYPGVTPDQVGKWDRSSTAIYADIDIDLTEALNVSVAGRYEDYSDFGSTFTYKVAGRYSLTDWLNLRAAVSTGFHAPTPGQQNITATQSSPDSSVPPPQPTIRKALISPTNPVALAFGGAALQPEESTNFSLGFVLTPFRGLTVSTDFYRIDVDDRIGILPDQKVTPAQRAILIGLGVPSAESLDTYRFFINGVDTRTEGVDVVGRYVRPVGPGQLTTTVAFNHNESSVKRFDARFASLDMYQFYEQRLPENVGSLALNYDIGRFSVFGRVRYYSAWTDVLNSGAAATLNQRVGEEVFADLSATVRINQGVNFTVGAENLFDNYPDEAPAFLQSGIGLKYPYMRAYEADGGRYYARLAVNF